MSKVRQVMSPERRERRRKIKRILGYESDHVSCTNCHREFTAYEIDTDDYVAVIGRTASVIFCRKCFRELYLPGGGGIDRHDKEAI